VCLPLVNAPPIHRLLISSEELRLCRLRGRPIIAQRSRDGIRFGRWLNRYLFFLVSGDGALATNLAFVPWSGSNLLGALERHGWQAFEDPAIVRQWPGFIEF